MTWIDWVIAGLLFFTALQGVQRGAAVSLLGAFGVIVSYLVASVWYVSLADVLVKWILLPRGWAGTFAFALLLLITYAAVGIAIIMFFESRKLSSTSRTLGAVVGAFKGALLSMAGLAIAVASPLGETMQKDVKASALAPYVVQAQQAGVKALAVILPIHPFGARETRF